MAMSARHDELVRATARGMDGQRLQAVFDLYDHLVRTYAGKVDCTEAARRLELTGEEIARRRGR